MVEIQEEIEEIQEEVHPLKEKIKNNVSEFSSIGANNSIIKSINLDKKSNGSYTQDKIKGLT